MTEKEAETARAYKLYSGPQHQEKGSEYYSYAFKAKNVKEVQTAYEKMRVKFADATHISCAYRLDNPIGPYRQQAIDDGDYGVARSMLKILKQNDVSCAGVFLVRFYGGIQLGKRRFQIAEQLTEKAMQAFRVKLADQRRKTKRQNSQSSISSVVSAASMMDAEELQDEKVETGEGLMNEHI